jgi:hypothetical protein
MTRMLGRAARDFASMGFWRTVVVLIAGMIAATLGRWVGDNGSPTQVISSRLLTPVVAPGESLKVRYTVERDRSCAVKIDRLLFDGEGVRYTLDDIESAAALGPIGRDEYTVSVQIPRGFARGRSAYRTVTTYVCNALHNVWPIIIRSEVQFDVAGPTAAEDLPIPVTPEVRG